MQRKPVRVLYQNIVEKWCILFAFIVTILATMFLCYHFHTQNSIPLPTFSAVLLVAMQLYNLISQIEPFIAL